MCQYSDMIHFAPGMAITAMENGGMMFDEDGQYVDAIDTLHTRGHLSVDVMNGDGDKGRVGVDYYDCDEASAEPANDESPEEEISRLAAEQEKDESETIYIYTEPAPEEFDEINPSHSGGTQRVDIGYETDHPSIGSSHRNRGRKPEYKDRRLRAAGSGKTRNIPTLNW